MRPGLDYIRKSHGSLALKPSTRLSPYDHEPSDLTSVRQLFSAEGSLGVTTFCSPRRFQDLIHLTETQAVQLQPAAVRVRTFNTRCSPCKISGTLRSLVPASQGRICAQFDSRARERRGEIGRAGIRVLYPLSSPHSVARVTWTQREGRS